MLCCYATDAYCFHFAVLLKKKLLKYFKRLVLTKQSSTSRGNHGVIRYQIVSIE